MEIKRVFILGIDGAGNGIKSAETPNLDRIFSKGSYTCDGEAVVPTISAECWGSTLLGVPPSTHMLTNNIADSTLRTGDSPFPSVFKMARDKFPQRDLASFSAWSPINGGIIENDIGCYFASEDDDKLVLSVSEYLKNHDPVILFLHLDLCDGAGHKHGYFTKEHFEAIEHSDKNVGIVLDAIERENMMDDSIIITLSDHGGGGANFHSHGSDTPQDKTIFWGICGPGVSKGVNLDKFSLMHTADIIKYALKLTDNVESDWCSKLFF